LYYNERIYNVETLGNCLWVGYQSCC